MDAVLWPPLYHPHFGKSHLVSQFLLLTRPQAGSIIILGAENVELLRASNDTVVRIPFRSHELSDSALPSPSSVSPYQSMMPVLHLAPLRPLVADPISPTSGPPTRPHHE
jgi:hypothetical protein